MERGLIPLGSAPATQWRVSGELVDMTRSGPPEPVNKNETAGGRV
jgi:hypothetical protein